MNTSDTQLDPRMHPYQAVYGVIGNPVAHSLSPLIHAQFALQVKQPIYYGKLYAELGQFRQTVDTFFARGGQGLNVTVPFKLEAFQICQKLTERAQAAGVVNILWQEEGQYVGDNSDGIGLVRDIEKHPFQIAEKRVLMIGAGGAVQGVILPFLEKKPSQITIANRTLAKAQVIVDRFLPQALACGIQLNAMALDQVMQLQEPYSVIINGTSSGLQGTSPLVADQAQHLEHIKQMAEPCLAYDMVYGKETDFMQQMRACGFEVKDGLGMLVEQAAEAFEVWRKLPQGSLDTVAVRQMLRQSIT